MIPKHEELEQIHHRGMYVLIDHSDMDQTSNRAFLRIFLIELKHQKIEQTPHRGMLYIFLLEDALNCGCCDWLVEQYGTQNKIKHTNTYMDNESRTIKKTQKS